MSQVAVAMFCGPHDEGDRVPTRRIDQAIDLARRLMAPLLIAGDAFEGREVDFFHRRALDMGVRSAHQAYDARHNTLSDAQAVAARLLTTGMHVHLAELHLVTDWWHMDRARAMLQGEIEKLYGRRIPVLGSSVLSGPQPSDLVIENERQGMRDYYEGVYGHRKVIDPLCHRPNQPFF